MGCDQPSFVLIGPLQGELWYFQYFQHGGRPPFWILKILIIDHVTVIAILSCCCVPNFIKIGSRVRPPNAYNCRMFNAPLLGNNRCHPLPWQPQHGGRPPSWIWILLFWTTHEVNYAVRLPCQNLVSIRYSPLEILQFYNFASLAGKCLNHAPFCFLGFEPLNIVVVIQTTKRHILGWRRVI